ncbi:uncharacterized protein TNCV_347081 [Trichonephila clavipes]|nr:uncharacterized protein TNCV_347081 [Trichonephila clavipes]
MYLDRRRVGCRSSSDLLLSNGTHIITPAVGAVCCCKANAGLRRSLTGSPHKNMIVITAEIDSGFVAKDDLVPFRCSPVSSCVAPLQTEASMSGRQG